MMQEKFDENREEALREAQQEKAGQSFCASAGGQYTESTDGTGALSDEALDAVAGGAMYIPKAGRCYFCGREAWNSRRINKMNGDVLDVMVCDNCRGQRSVHEKPFV